MPRRSILTDRQRSALFDLPTNETTLLHHYILADDDITNIMQRRKPQNRLGFALQLCAFRYPGRLLQSGEIIPLEVSRFIAAQLGMGPEDLSTYALREETRREHLIDLRETYGFKMFAGPDADKLKSWLQAEAEVARSNEDIAKRFVDECRHRLIILPGISVIERLCADSLVAADRNIESRIVDRLDEEMKSRLDATLTETMDGNMSRFIWLRRFEVGNNSADASRLLDRLEFLNDFNLPYNILEGIPPHRITRLRRQGERYFTDGLVDISSDRRLAILAVCAIEWRAAIADTIVDTHDRIVGKTWRNAKSLCDQQIQDARSPLQDTLRSFKELGLALLEAKASDQPLETVMEAPHAWSNLENMVASAGQLTDTISSDPIAYLSHGYHRFRRYAPRMFRALDIHTSSVSKLLASAIKTLTEEKCKSAPKLDFLRRKSKWRRHITAGGDNNHKLWEVAVMFHVRDAFRSGDIWLGGSRRFADLKDVLIPLETAQRAPQLTMPLDPHAWLDDRKRRLTDGIKRLSKAGRQGTIPGGSIENGIMKLDRLTAAVPKEADKIVLDLYGRLPSVRITDLLQEVDDDIGFTDAFTHLRTGSPCKDRLGLLNVILAEGLNLDLSKMAEATSSHNYYQLSRLSRWHVEGDAIDQALAMVVKAQSKLPMAEMWGSGITASSDGQFFPSARQGEAMNLINAKYGSEPGLKAYTHVTDQYAPFATQNIPATVSEAPYILDGLLMNEIGRKIKEQYADTGAFTDHLFATTSLLAYRFIPRIRDLPSKRLYVFRDQYVPQNLKGLIGGRIRENMIVENWPDVVRSIATLRAGVMKPSQLLKKFAAYPRQHELALALREIGRVERTLFIIDWLLDIDMQRRAQIGLNKGEAHHALKNALRIGRQGEVRDRTSEGQHFRIAGLNLLAAIIIYWNTKHLGHAVLERERGGLDCSSELLAHISPLGWAHILLIGEYRWKTQTSGS